MPARHGTFHCCRLRLGQKHTLLCALAQMWGPWYGKYRLFQKCICSFLKRMFPFIFWVKHWIRCWSDLKKKKVFKLQYLSLWRWHLFFKPQTTPHPFLPLHVLLVRCVALTAINKYPAYSHMSRANLDFLGSSSWITHHFHLDIVVVWRKKNGPQKEQNY